MSNPLISYMNINRVYCRLPSAGKFYNPNLINCDAADEIPIKAMSARDEFQLNNAQALMNGQAVAEVIQNCVPDIKDANFLNVCDVEVLLLGIKQASGDDTYSVPVECPECTKKGEVTRDITRLLDNLEIHPDKHTYKINDLELVLIPCTWKLYNIVGRSRFEQNKLIKTITSPDFAGLSEEEKHEKINVAFNKLVDYTYDLMTGSVIHITTPDGTVSDPAHIREYLQSLPKEHYTAINEKLAEINNMGVCKIETVVCTECSHEWEESIDRFDPSAFFD